MSRPLPSVPTDTTATPNGQPPCVLQGVHNTRTLQPVVSQHRVGKEVCGLLDHDRIPSISKRGTSKVERARSAGSDAQLARHAKAQPGVNHTATGSAGHSVTHLIRRCGYAQLVRQHTRNGGTGFLIATAETVLRATQPAMVHRCRHTHGYRHGRKSNRNRQ